MPEEAADGINIVQVEHRPPWEKMVFMMKNGSMQLVGVPNEEMAATLSTQGYKRVTVAFYSTGADLPGGSADKSGAAEEEDDNDMQLAPVVVTIPNALPGIKAGANDPSAAEQVVEQFEVSCTQCCSTCLDLDKSDHLSYLVRLWVPSAKSRVLVNDIEYSPIYLWDKSKRLRKQYYNNSCKKRCDIYCLLQGGFDPNKTTRWGTMFGLLVHSLSGPNKQRALKPSMV